MPARLSVALAGFFLAAVVAYADDKPDAAAADLKAMVGKWKIEKAESGGEDITPLVKDAKFEILGGGKYTLELTGAEKDSGTFTVDPSKSPKEIDVKPTAGPLKGKTMKAIYKIDGDAMTICYQHDLEGGKPRPEKFETKGAPTLVLIVYKRAK